MKISHPCRALLTVATCGIFLMPGGSAASAADVLKAGTPLLLPGTHGKFDFLAMDADGRRLLAAHTGNDSLDVIDLDRHVLVKSIPTGKAQDSVVDAKAGRYYVTTSEPPQVVTVDIAKLTVVGKVSLPGPADLAALDANSGKVYVGHDDGKELWVVDAVQNKVAGTVELPGEAPEDLAFDPSHTRLFQSMKIGNIVAVVNVADGVVREKWPTSPVENPHGMAIVPEADAFLIAGGNGKLVLMGEKDGHILASADIPPRVDQIAYDADLHRVYCASGTGKIAVVGVENGTLQTLGEISSAEGAHSIAVDPKTHAVWIAYAKDDASYVQSFEPVK